MAELDEPADEPNFDLFGSSGLDFFSDDELLFSETDNSTMKTLTFYYWKPKQKHD